MSSLLCQELCASTGVNIQCSKLSPLRVAKLCASADVTIVVASFLPSILKCETQTV